MKNNPKKKIPRALSPELREAIAAYIARFLIDTTPQSEMPVCASVYAETDIAADAAPAEAELYPDAAESSARQELCEEAAQEAPAPEKPAPKPGIKYSRALEPAAQKSRQGRYANAVAASVSPAAAPQGLEDAVRQLDESLSEMLLRKIDEKGISDAACYKKARVDRKLFSKIRSDKHYRPSKPTAVAFALALELGIEETRELLMKAGFALSHSNKFDIIVEFFILAGKYDIDEINEALYAFDQPLIGC